MNLLRAHRGLWLILALALGLRLIPLGLVLANGGSPLIGDEGNYVQAAQSLAQGGGIPDLWVWIRPPGYIVFAAAIFWLAAGSLIALQLAQIAVSLLTIVLTYVLVLRGLGVGGWGLAGGDQAQEPLIQNSKLKTQNSRSVALAAAAIVAVQPSLIFATGLFLTETLFLGLLTALIGALVGYWRATTPRAALAWAATAGVLAAITLLTRTSGTPLLVLALGVFLAQRRWPSRRRLAAVALFGVCLALVLLPWTVRNAARYGRFLPVDTAGYEDLWIDNTDLHLDEVRGALGQVPNPADRGAYALNQALQWVGAHPDAFLARTAQRAIDSLAPDDFTQLGYPIRDKLPGRDSWERDLFSFAAWWGWALLFGGALAGWLRAPRTLLWSLTGGVVGLYILTSSLTHNEFRYRFPLFGLLAIYAAVAALSAWEWLRRRATVLSPRPPSRTGKGALHDAPTSGREELQTTPPLHAGETGKPSPRRGEGRVRGESLLTPPLPTGDIPPSPHPSPPLEEGVRSPGKAHPRFPRREGGAGGVRKALLILQIILFLAWMASIWPTFWMGFSQAVQAEQALANGAAARAGGDLVAAQAAYTAAAGLEPTFATPRRELGAVQVQAGQAQAATATWTDALAHEPGDWRTRALLADLWRGLGQTKRATGTTRDVPATFNGAMLDWAWDHLSAPAPLTLTAGLDDIGFVRDFQIGETGPDGRAYRWAGPGAESSIRLRSGQPGGARLTLMLNALPQAPPLPAARPVTVMANGQPLGTLAVAPGWAPYTFDLPAALSAAPEIVLTFDSPSQQASAQDPRYLSFALNTATLTPAP